MNSVRSRILLVMPRERRDSVLRSLSGSSLEFASAETAKAAKGFLAGPVKYDLAIVDAELPDGSWRDVLRFLVASRAGCEMVVCSRCGDEQLWAEVIQCGAFDLVPEPFERQEMQRIIRSALDSRYLQRFGHASQERAC
jgi:DNA-binding NtrC family response regulator